MTNECEALARVIDSGAFEEPRDESVTETLALMHRRDKACALAKIIIDAGWHR